ncbi:MAG: hypothetical protein JZD40_02760, partial [Sulfolobus sp.]|nr:hypothetical protein [Sulfolobus sp.]
MYEQIFRGIINRRTKRLLQRLSIIIAIIVVIGVVSYLAISNLPSSRPKVVPVTTTLVSTTSVTITSTIVPNITTTTTSIITKTKSIIIVPPNLSQLIDVSWTAAPDALDPATGFYVQDGP